MGMPDFLRNGSVLVIDAPVIAGLGALLNLFLTEKFFRMSFACGDSFACPPLNVIPMDVVAVSRSGAFVTTSAGAASPSSGLEAFV